VLSNDFYVDDVLSGTSTLEDAIKMQQQISSLLQTAGITLRKWACKNSTFLNTIPNELQDTKQTMSLDNEDGITNSDYYGIQNLINFKSRTTLPSCKPQDPKRVQNAKC
jgi:hypothetical protein